MRHGPKRHRKQITLSRWFLFVFDLWFWLILWIGVLCFWVFEIEKMHWTELVAFLFFLTGFLVHKVWIFLKFCWCCYDCFLYCQFFFFFYVERDRCIKFGFLFLFCCYCRDSFLHSQICWEREKERFICCTFILKVVAPVWMWASFASAYPLSDGFHSTFCLSLCLWGGLGIKESGIWLYICYDFATQKLSCVVYNML